MGYYEIEKVLGLHCPHCGSAWEKTGSRDGLDKWKCPGCGSEFIVKTDNTDALYACRTFQDKIVFLLEESLGMPKRQKIAYWKSKKREGIVKQELSRYSGTIDKDPLCTILKVAYHTNGFTKYPSGEAKKEIDNYYQFSYDFIQTHPNATYIKRYVEQYKNGLRSRLRNRLIALCSVFIGVVVACFIALGMYAPAPSDFSTNIQLQIPGGSLSMFDKFGLRADAELQPSSSVSYIDAKNALRNETETFTLYDISLISGDRTVQPTGAVKVTVPIPEGYQTNSLKVYYVESDEKYEEIPSTVSLANNTISFETTHFSLYAIAERYPIVTFDSQNGSESVRQIIERDHLVTMPDEPKKIGYHFGGWQNGAEKWDFLTDTVKKDMTLTAKWIPNEYTVTLDLNGGVASVDSVTVLYDSQYFGLPSPQKAGYTFAGWYTSETNGNRVTSETRLTTAENHTLYAVYNKNKNRITFDANGGMGDMPDFEIDSGETARLPENIFTRTGYNFIGWSTGITGDVVYNDKSTYTMGTDSVYTLYAKWSEPVVYTVVFETNGGSSISNKNYTVNSGLVGFEIPSKAGYTFEGWYDNRALDGEPITEVKVGTAGNVTFYAKWSVNGLKLSFNTMGGETMQDMAFDIQTGIASLPDAVRSGYIFEGWYEDSSCTGSRVISVPEGINHNIVLYAKWSQPVVYTVEFDSNGGSSVEKETYTVNSGISVFVKPVKSAYDFAGWYDNESLEGTPVEKIETGTSGNITLYAKWIPMSYSLTFVSNGGTDIAQKNYTIESGASGFGTPHRDGYKFAGWYESATLQGYPITEIKSGTIGNITLYAKWENRRFTYSNTTKSKPIGDTGSYGAYRDSDRVFETLNFSEFSQYTNSNYTFKFTITITISEKNDGYQEVLLWKNITYDKMLEISESTAKDNGYVTGSKIEHSPNKKDTTPRTFYKTWEVSGDNIEEIMYIRYDAQGGGDDDWYRHSIYIVVDII